MEYSHVSQLWPWCRGIAGGRCGSEPGEHARFIVNPAALQARKLCACHAQHSKDRTLPTEVPRQLQQFRWSCLLCGQCENHQALQRPGKPASSPPDMQGLHPVAEHSRLHGHRFGNCQASRHPATPPCIQRHHTCAGGPAEDTAGKGAGRSDGSQGLAGAACRGPGTTSLGSQAVGCGACPAPESSVWPGLVPLVGAPTPGTGWASWAVA